MANITKSRTDVAKIYIAAFNRVPDSAGLDFWVSSLEAGTDTIDSISQKFTNSTEYKAMYPAYLTSDEYISAIYQNVFGRAADAEGKAFWISKLEDGSLTNGTVMKAMVDSTVTNGSEDGPRLDNQAEYGVYTAVNKVPFESANAQLSKIDSTPASLETAKAAVADEIGGTTGKTFVLTTGTDTLTGTSDNDKFTSNVETVNGTKATDGTIVQNFVNTLQATDVLKGGAGIDTLDFTTKDTTANTLIGKISEIEVINAKSLGALTIDSSKYTDVTNLNILEADGAVKATAANKTDISVNLKEGTESPATALNNTIEGGKNITVNATEMGAAANADAIIIGAAAADATTTTTTPTGDVVVNVTGKAYDADVKDATLGDISVHGGKTISVTQTATSDMSAADSDTGAASNKIVQGAVKVYTTDKTTEVTVKQDAAVTTGLKDAAETTGGVTETASVKFGILKAGETLTTNGLTLTATKQMAADEVASAFSNLINGKAYGSVVPAGDTQSDATYTNGTYTGKLTANTWTSAAATGDTVVFTSTTANSNIGTDLVFTGTGVTNDTKRAPEVTTTQGKAHDATITGGVAGIDTGVVTITDSSATLTGTAVKTITVDGYKTGSASTATTTALETINLSNGVDFTLATSSADLDMNLEKVDGKIEVTAGVKTLNINSIGANDAKALTASTATALNVKGTGLLTTASAVLGSTKTITVSETAGLDLTSATLTNLESVDTTATTGTTTIAIDGTKATYKGGAGNDVVTVANIDAISKAIDLGNGNNSLTLTGATITTPTAELKAGTGTNDIIGMKAVNAASLTASNQNFADKITGFERLSITDELDAAVSREVKLENLDNISYVISNGSAATVDEHSVTVSVDANVVANNTASITIDGKTFTTAALSADATATNVADALATAIKADADAYAAAGYTVDADSDDNVVITTKTGLHVDVSAVTINQGTALTVGAISSINTFTGSVLTLTNIANNGTVELAAAGMGAVVTVKDADTNTADDTFNIVTGETIGNDALVNYGTATIHDVEILNVTTTDTFVDNGSGIDTKNSVGQLNINADTAETINVNGAGDLTLTLSGATKAVTAINASTMDGALTVDLTSHNHDALITVTGGNAADILKASTTADAKADVLNGGAGADTLYAGSNNAKLTGGADNDLFVLNSGTLNALSSSKILDFQAGDILQLENSSTHVSSFTKLTADLGTSTDVTAYADAAMAQAADGAAVWFQIGTDSYVAIDNGTTSTAFVGGIDSIIQVTGVDLTNASFNSDYGTITIA